MRNTLIAICMLALAGCATTGGEVPADTDTSPAQHWRQKGADESLSITGTIDHYYFKHSILTVKIGGTIAASGPLSDAMTGEVSGDYKGKPVSAICSSERKTRAWIDVRCMVLVDNERTVTLTF